MNSLIFIQERRNTAMLHEVSFKSYNKRDTVYGWIYVPAAEYKGVVQLIHGFGEHARRYLHMISAFVDAGYIVACDDHVGHGKTALENNSWGDWGDQGWHTMMEDEHTLTGIVKEKYPDLPYFLFGHSMGSFIVKDYITKYADELKAVTLCGTAGDFPGSDEAEKMLKALIDSGKGEESDPEAAGNLMGWMNERCGEVKIGNEWICDDPYVQYDHANDPFDAFTRPTTNRAMYYFVEMLQNLKGTSWAEKVPADLPINMISGDQDPVGMYGKGVKQIYDALKETGHQDVEMKLYEGYRHEIHNYKDIRSGVENQIIGFMDSKR
jgi:alpha-beta hydrolase superfamily lysophospholipase